MAAIHYSKASEFAVVKNDEKRKEFENKQKTKREESVPGKLFTK
tara:strand:+ start:542 stop:673 length:132 start_codon:yes stop_codon:yes gene_type:complete